MQYKFTGALTTNGWLLPAYIEVDDSGTITRVSNKPLNNNMDEEVSGYAIPGFRNSHSHAFQYAMAGTAEIHQPGTHDDFWSWREKMYQVALTMDPDQMEKVAAFLFSEMLRFGYTQVAEFHYVHHDKDGTPYSNLSELGERLVAAASTAGIKITLIPIFYKTGNFGQPPMDHQRRFICKNYDAYIHLWEASEKSASKYAKASLGIGVHSLRAVDDDALIRLTENFDPQYPFHLHVAEQLKEVNDCVAFYGKRPVEWLLENIQLTDSFHLIHATHMNEKETRGLASTGANVVLCPSTEGNLGDGIFPLSAFKNAGGNWSLGTDSHIGLNPLEELRLLDYRERLVTHQRNVLNDETVGDSGALGFKKVLEAGRLAMGDMESGYLDQGCKLDAVVFSDSNPLLQSSKPEFLLSTIIYSLDPSQTLGTLVDGKWAVKGEHPEREKLQKDFVEVVKEIGIR